MKGACSREVLPQRGTHRYGAVVARSTGYEHESAAPAYFCDVLLDPAEHHLVRLEVDSSSHRIHHRLGLFEDLLLHKRTVVPYREKVNATVNHGTSIKHWTVLLKFASQNFTSRYRNSCLGNKLESSYPYYYSDVITTPSPPPKTQTIINHDKGVN